MNANHFDLSTLRLFLIAAETGSLTRAAVNACITLSAVSKRIAELEKNLNCQLFIRQPRGLVLTAAGQGLMRHARKVLASVNTMASELSDYAMGATGQVRVAANVSAVIQFLPDDFATFFAASPRVRICLEELLSETVIDAVESGRADIGIFADNVDASAITTFPWRQDQLVVLAPVDHPLASQQSIWFEETLAWDYVALNPGSSLQRRFSDEAIGAGQLLKVTIQVTSFDALCRMILAGLGIGILPLGAITPALLGSSLQAIRLNDAWSQRRLRLGIHRCHPLQPEAQKLLDSLLSATSPPC